MTTASPATHQGKRMPRSSSRFLADRTGTAAVEFGMLALPFVMLVIGILQFVILHYTQQLLSDALYSSASNPEAVLIAENKTAYVTLICNKIPIQMNCAAGLQVEMMRLSDMPTASTAIAGTTFDSGAKDDVLVLRATVQALQIIPYIPAMTARDSVVFRRTL